MQSIPLKNCLPSSLTKVDGTFILKSSSSGTYPRTLLMLLTHPIKRDQLWREWKPKALSMPKIDRPSPGGNSKFCISWGPTGFNRLINRPVNSSEMCRCRCSRGCFPGTLVLFLVPFSLYIGLSAWFAISDQKLQMSSSEEKWIWRSFKERTTSSFTRPTNPNKTLSHERPLTAFPVAISSNLYKRCIYVPLIFCPLNQVSARNRKPATGYTRPRGHWT